MANISLFSRNRLFDAFAALNTAALECAFPFPGILNVPNCFVDGRSEFNDLFLFVIKAGGANFILLLQNLPIFIPPVIDVFFLCPNEDRLSLTWGFDDDKGWKEILRLVLLEAEKTGPGGGDTT